LQIQLQHLPATSMKSSYFSKVVISLESLKISNGRKPDI
jgi:hypothetical protein